MICIVYSPTAVNESVGPTEKVADFVRAFVLRLMIEASSAGCPSAALIKYLVSD